MEQFSEKLKQLRKQSKSTQVDMAKLLECTEQHYQRIEYGKVNIPTLTLIQLCNYFNVSADYLLGLSDNPKRQ